MTHIVHLQDMMAMAIEPKKKWEGKLSMADALIIEAGRGKTDPKAETALRKMMREMEAGITKLTIEMTKSRGKKHALQMEEASYISLWKRIIEQYLVPVMAQLAMDAAMWSRKYPWKPTEKNPFCLALESIPFVFRGRVFHSEEDGKKAPPEKPK